jgi:hypothetical protein
VLVDLQVPEMVLPVKVVRHFHISQMVVLEELEEVVLLVLVAQEVHLLQTVI